MSRAALRAINFLGKTIAIKSGDDSASFRIEEKLSGGETASAWIAKSKTGRTRVIKVVWPGDYINHSLEGEMQRVANLGSTFAQTFEYGDLLCDGAPLRPPALGIVLEFIPGISLRDFALAKAAALSVQEFLYIFKQLCVALANLEANALVHNDLHGGNILLVDERDAITEKITYRLKVIDTGTLKTVVRKTALLKEWNDQLLAIESIEGDGVAGQAAILRERIQFFSRSDQEWIVCHACELVRAMTTSLSSRRLPERKFLLSVHQYFSRMVDDNLSMRLSKPAQMVDALEKHWSSCMAGGSPGLPHPFDYISAELIRSDTLLNKLFSAKCPWYQQCLGSDPIYLYGPRGCGKSTVMRMLSLPAVLSGDDPGRAFFKGQYIGVYVSCITELKSRFIHFDDVRYANYDSDIIRYFVLLLLERLMENLELLCDGVAFRHLGRDVGLTDSVQRKIYLIITRMFGAAESDGEFPGTSWICRAKRTLHGLRNQTWDRIVHNQPSATASEPHKIQECISEIEKEFPLLQERRIAFLLDDYSNQRIPQRLQQILNQAITFTKSGNPIFKVSSEYEGVDLTGVQEGREVVEINCGKEFVSLTGSQAPDFIEDVLDIRFTVSGDAKRSALLLGKSGLGAGEEIAQLVKDHFSDGREFAYHGIDTISHICSGDLSMALDLVKSICNSHGNGPMPIPKKQQHAIINQYASNEHRHLRFYLPHGMAMAAVMDSLCWLAQESAAKCTEIKEDQRRIPLIRTGLDVNFTAIAGLPAEKQEVFSELIKRGALFSLETSRTRRGNAGTLRYQIRRILLARYLCPLSRRTSIKLEDTQSILFLLGEPRDFCKNLLKTSSPRNAEPASAPKPTPDQERIAFDATDLDHNG